MTNEGEEAKKSYENHLDSLKGLVYDSCPGKRVIKSLYYAMVDHVLIGIKFWRIIKFLGHFVKLFGRMFANRGQPDTVMWWDYWTTNHDLKAPSLFLCSANDKCIQKAHVEVVKRIVTFLKKS